MKKYIQLTLLSVLWATGAVAQVDTVFFNAKWKITKQKDSFEYYRPTPTLKNDRYEVRDYYINGRLQMLGYYTSDAKGLMSDDNLSEKYQDGRFEYYYPDGKLKQEGTCVAGLYVGDWKYYYANGNIKSIQTHKKGKQQGRYIHYDSLKSLPLYTGMYKDDAATGEWEYFFTGTDKLKCKLTFANNMLEGNAIYYDSLTGKVKVRGAFSKNEKHGTWKVFGESGKKLESVERFENGKRHGEKIYYHPGSEKIWIESTFFMDSLHGQLNTYYESGKPKRKETYLSGQITSSKCYNEGGGEIEYFPLIKEATFPGDVMTYIGDNLRYPQEARNRGLEGKVVVSFDINESGLVKNAVILQGLDKACDDEAIRLISQMPPWQPEYVDGVACSSRKTLPVVFWLLDKDAKDAD